MQITCDLRNQCIYTCSSPLRWQSDLYSSNTATNGEMIGLGTNALMSKLEHVVRTLANTRTYSRHLTAASWKLWCRLVSTVDMLFNAVSMNMALSCILKALFRVSVSPGVHLSRQYCVGIISIVENRFALPT